ncbi:MAG: ribonuclease Z [Anaerolineae bacterium]|jgi:ribonuclease Z|nr:ribonuclease Z [Anaerolineae bacterium]
MFEIFFLGTSASAPAIHRGLPSCVILAGEHRFMIDCGEGTQRQLLRSGLGYKRLNKILLTHGHLDHILGLGGLISTFVHWGSIEEIEIWGGKPALDRVESLIYQVVLRDERPPIPIHLYDLRDGRMFRTKEFDVSAFPVTHRGGGNFGFIFQEFDRSPFLADKAEALGIPNNAERGKLVRGESITLADGRLITPDMVLGETIHGAKLVYVGDTGRIENLRPHVQNADALIIEATFLESEAEEAKAYGHITAHQAATLALESGVKALILNHISGRYRERDILNEARAIFPNAYVARDFDHFMLKRGGELHKIIPTPPDEEHDDE